MSETIQITRVDDIACDDQELEKKAEELVRIILYAQKVN